MDNNLEAKLLELIDRQEIWSLLLRYSRGLDRLDRALIRSCYWDSAIDDHHTFVGTADEFIDWAMAFHLDHNTVHHHGVSNHFVELDGDQAYGETYYTYIAANKRAPHSLAIGRYIDHFERHGNVWKIANRVCVTERLFELSAGDDAAIKSAAEANGTPLPATRNSDDLSYHRPVVPRQPLRE